MFTGLIERTGEIAGMDESASGYSLRVMTPLAAEMQPGDSVAVSGVCLTVVAADAEGFRADISPETARVTSIARWRTGSLVNLERPLRADSRLGGHFVQGHVDATGSIATLRPDGESYRLTVRHPPDLSRFIIRKGSIAVDGISLTVAAIGEHEFDVQVIPFTWTATNLHAAKAGDIVNLECDVLGKYVARALELSRIQ